MKHEADGITPKSKVLRAYRLPILLDEAISRVAKRHKTTRTNILKTRAIDGTAFSEVADEYNKLIGEYNNDQRKRHKDTRNSKEEASIIADVKNIT